MIDLTPAEEQWVINKREEEKKVGAHWLTPEGIAEIRDIWGDQAATAMAIMVTEIDKLMEMLRVLHIRFNLLAEEIDRLHTDKAKAIEDAFRKGYRIGSVDLDAYTSPSPDEDSEDEEWVHYKKQQEIK